MKARLGISPILFAVLLLAGCDMHGSERETAAACEDRALAGDFSPLRQKGDDPVVATAIATAARLAGTERAGLLENYASYEGRTRGDGARCFRFIPKHCGVGGEVTMCVTAALVAQDVTASE